MTILSELLFNSAREGLDAEIHPSVDIINLNGDDTGATLTLHGGERGSRDWSTGYQDYWPDTELTGKDLLDIAMQTKTEMSDAAGTLDISIQAFPALAAEDWDTADGEVIIDHRPQALRELARLLPGGGDSMRLAEVCLTRAAGFFRWRPPQHRTEIDYIRGGMELAEARRHLNDAFYHSAATGPYVGHVIALTEPMTPDQIRSLDLSEWQKNWDALEAIAKDARHEATRAFRRSNTAA